MTTWRFTIVGALAILFATLGAGGSPALAQADRTIQRVTGGPDSYSFRLTTPTPLIRRQPDGTDSIRIEGFGTLERRPGAPDVPTKTVLVAVPPDADPVLEVRARRERLLRGVRPAAVPARGGAGRAAERALPDPERVAWLGRRGVLRDQPYVEVHLAPVRHDPRAGGLRVRDELEVVVHFRRRSSAPLAPVAPEPRFESIYREAFVNYEQSLSFRRESLRPESASSEASRIGAAAPEGGTLPRQRILVRQSGPMRLDAAALQTSGLLAHDVTTWRLTNRGVPIGLEIQDDGDGILEPGEWVQFWGQALDDEPKTVLNYDFEFTDNDLFEARDFTDVNTYFLTVETAPQPAMEQVDAAPTFSRTPPSHFAARARQEVDDFFLPLGPADPWFWGPTLRLNRSSRTEIVPLPGLFSGTQPLTARIHFRGVSEDFTVVDDHHTRVTMRNGSSSVLAVDDGFFDDRDLFLHEISWSFPGAGAQATDPLRFVLEVLPTAASRNEVLLDYVEVDYRRGFGAIGDRLVFDWPDGDAEFVVTGLVDPAARIYEITVPPGGTAVRARRLINPSVSGAGPYSVRFRVDQDPSLPDGTPRRFAVIGQGAAIAPGPGDLVADTVSDLRDTAQQADLIVIAHPDLLDASPAAPLGQWLGYRASGAGGGLSSKVVLLQDVEDEFGFGLPGPTAIREFLRWVMSDQPGEGWAEPKPSYVLLLGDGSFDYKGGTAQGNYVPTQIVYKNDLQFGYYAADNLLAAVVGDDSMPDLIVSRIPARSLADVNLILQKILDYEQIAPAGDWRNHVLFISDRGKINANPGEALEFERINAIGESTVPRPPFSSRNLRYWTDYFNTPNPNPWDSINADIKAAINGLDPLFPTAAGTSIVQYIGHGNWLIWSDDFFFDERLNPPSDSFQDSMDLTNGGRLPWLMAHNCLTGAFQDRAYNSMGENWLKRSGGGAVGVFSPSGLSYPFIGEVVTESVWGAMFGPRKERETGAIAYGALVALCGQGSVEACQGYALLGDAATRLVLRHVEPPTALQAVAGNAEIDLVWTASSTPGTTYDVYRATAPQGTYTRVATGLAGTTFHDPGLVNARTYYYYTVAVDGQGFVSAWSNFNSDCAIPGPDCVRATPLNPGPPSIPAGLAVTDPGVGHVLELSWAPNPETDLDFYTLHYGTDSGVYGSSLVVAGRTRTTLSGLVEGQMYYFALTATNTSGNTSALSDEVSDFPVFGLGLRSPSYIDDLVLRKSFDDVVLEWGEVTTDIYGKPTSASSYEIFRGSGSTASIASLTKIGECASPCTSFTDPGALLLPGDLHYRVRAVDAAQNVGGLGSEPPAPTELRVGRGSTEGSIRLTWSSVQTTVDGSPVQLQHYVVYAADQPFSRLDVRDGAIAPLTTVVGTSVDLTPPPQDRYYSVLAVDIRGNVSPY